MCSLSMPADKLSMTTDLMKVPMRIMDWKECTKVFPVLTNNMLCAAYDNESYDACQVTRGSGPSLNLQPVDVFLARVSTPPPNRLRF